VPHTLPLLWLRTRPHTTLPCQPASGTRSQTCWLLSVYNKQNQTFHVQQRCIDAFAYVCYLYSTLCLKRRTNFETVSLEIIKIDFDDIWQKYSKDSKEFASLSVRAGLLFLSVFRLSNRTPKTTRIFTLSSKRAYFDEVQLFIKHTPKLIIFGTHNLQIFKHNTCINELLLMQFYLLNIRPKLHHRKWRKLCVTLPVNRRNMRTLFSVCSLRDDNVITSKPTWKLKHTNSILE